MIADAWMVAACAVAAGFAVTAVFTGWIVTRRRFRWLVDRPNERSLHDRPVSRAGGLAVAAGLACGLTVAALLEPPGPGIDWGVGWGVDWGGGWVLAGALLVAAVSFADDLRGVAPAIRIVVHLCASGCVVLAGLTAERIALPWATLELGAVAGAAFTILLVAWLVNLYNFMDGMDGFAGGMSAVGFVTLALLCAQGGAGALAVVSGVVAASALGFLPYNFPPARVFMGDLGASLFGYLCAVTMLAAERSASVPLWIPVLVFSPFVVDATVTLGRRVVAGERPWHAHRSHFYQRLVRLGWGHRKTVLRQYALMLACAGSAAAAPWLAPPKQGVLLGAWAVVYIVLMVAVTNLERRADA